MSADNWGTCPRCMKKFEARVEEQTDAMRAAYGTVPADEYLRMQRDLVALTQTERPDDDTLREDYGIGIDSDGEFFVRYSASCENCGLTYSFDYDYQVVG